MFSSLESAHAIAFTTICITPK
jgi:hypothetical protein